LNRPCPLGGPAAFVSQLSTEAPDGEEEKGQEGSEEEEKEESSRKEETRTQGGQEKGEAQNGEKSRGQAGGGDRGIAEYGVVDDPDAGRSENRSESRGRVAFSDGLQALKQAGRESSCAQSGAVCLGLGCRSRMLASAYNCGCGVGKGWLYGRLGLLPHIGVHI
jgi:hypothetical protein